MAHADPRPLPHPVTTLAALPADAAFDLVVVGAGGAGLSTALHAAIDGARVLLIESTGRIGGTTALSAGTTWIPATRHAATVAPDDNLGAAARYLDQVVGDHSPRALREAFLRHGAEAVERFEQQTSVHYRPYARHPDYQSELPGATLCGRAMEPVPFDGRQLGALFGLLREPIPEFTVLGGMMVDRTDINHLLGFGRRWASTKHGLGLIARHAIDRLSRPRGTRLVMGNALVARLLHSLAAQPSVKLLLETRLTAIGRDATGRISDITLQQAGVERRIGVGGGLVLASGGINRQPAWRAAHLPAIDIAWCPGAPGHLGDAQELALGLGARRGGSGAAPAFLSPVSLRKRADGSTAVFPHFVMDRAKPGVMTVDQDGRRYQNESHSYHLFGLAMLVRGPKALPSWLVCDAVALKRYGLGMVRPGGRGLEPFLADGYLLQGASLAELAGRMGCDAATLQTSVTRMNELARSGRDSDFQRGETDYQRNLGDASLGGANPNLGTLETGPFYALRLYPGDIGAATGLVTDADARVLDGAGQPIAGLYAVGNDMQSMMGGTYPGPGITIGPGMVFGYLAARHALGRARALETAPREAVSA